MTKDEALKLALEALEHEADIGNDDAYKLEREAIKEALAQPWEKFCDSNCVWTDHHPDCKLAQPEHERFLVATIGNWGRVEWADGVFPSLGDKMYSAPRTWVGLTLDEVLDMARTFGAQPWPPNSCAALGKMIEAKLKEKNT